MKITARPFAKNWTVILTATIAFLVWLWKAIDNVSVAEFILQKTGTQETVFRYLAHPKAPDIAFLIVFGLLLLSLFFQIERDKPKQDEGEQKEPEPRAYFSYLKYKSRILL